MENHWFQSPCYGNCTSILTCLEWQGRFSVSLFLCMFPVCIGNMSRPANVCLDEPSFWLRLRQLLASLRASLHRRLVGVSYPDTEVARNCSPNMQRGVPGGWAGAPASILVPIVSAVDNHQHCTCCLVCQRWLHLLSECCTFKLKCYNLSNAWTCNRVALSDLPADTLCC